MNKFEMSSQNLPKEPIETPSQEVEFLKPKIEVLDSRIIESSKQELRDLFKFDKNPIASLVDNIEKSETAGRISKELSASIIEKLKVLKFSNEADFINGAIEITVPILELTKQGKTGLYKQEGREMFTDDDMEIVTNIIKKSGAQIIFVVGNVGSGKTTFAKELSALVSYENIDLDKWFGYFRKEHDLEVTDLKELLDYVLEKNKPPFVEKNLPLIINHADLLRQDLIEGADMVVFLNPSKTELLKTRQIRTEDGADGEWKNVKVDDYDEIAKTNLDKLEALGGKEEYNNQKSGTIVRLLKK